MHAVVNLLIFATATRWLRIEGLTGVCPSICSRFALSSHALLDIAT
ncbi:hypothetical protein BFJ71_g16759 [Fusarium oxysporum]|nr:hypothetical protein BFJ71_g16759 [Fusarium oxysporum]